MSAGPTVKKYAVRFWSLGYSRVFLILGIVLALLALATPMWSILLGTPGPANDWASTSYGWTSRTQDEYLSGSLSTTRIEYYSSPDFHDRLLSSAIANSYTWIVVFVVLLVLLTVLFSSQWGRTMPRLGLLVAAILAVVVGLVAVFYPIATVPNAAASDLGVSAINGFWGTASPPTFSWGAGAGWWLLLGAAVLGILGASLPYLQHMRVLPEPRPRSWPPAR